MPTCAAPWACFSRRACNVRASLVDYALFGLCCGCALASRINLAPLAGLLVLATVPRILSQLRARNPMPGMLRRDGAGLLLAGGLTLLVFRVLNPYAFSGPGFFGLAA